MNKNQTGFGVIEILLIIIVAGVLGATGWYALHTKHQTDQILSESEKTSQSTPRQSGAVKSYEECAKAAGSRIEATYPPICVTKDGKQFPQPISNAGQHYLTIKEWGVRTPYSGSDLSIKVDGNRADIDSAELNKKFAACEPGGLTANIVRYTNPNTQADVGGDTAASLLASSRNNIPSVYDGKKYAVLVGGNYYVFYGPQGSCGTSQSDIDMEQQVANAALALFKGIQVIPQ